MEPRHFWTKLSLAALFTENGKVLPLGQGLWLKAGMVKYTQSALDTETCNAATQAVVPEASTDIMDIPLGLRLKLADQKISEIETMAVRPGDYQVSGSDFPSNPGAISAANDVVKWEQAVPTDKRNTRDEIAAGSTNTSGSSRAASAIPLATASAWKRRRFVCV